MAKTTNAARFPHSLWERLTDPSLQAGDALAISQASQLDRLRKEILTHLEWLLNSRCCVGEAIEGSEVLRGSIVGYGLPDLSALWTGDPRDRDRLQRTLEDAIRRFEPRLKDVRVEFNPAGRDPSRSMLHYRVSAVIQVKPIARPIQFDTVLELGSKAFLVRGAE